MNQPIEFNPTHIAAAVLSACRAHSWRFPKPNPEITQRWAYGIARNPYPPELYVEAVDFLFATNHPPENVGQVIAGCKRIVADWERTPGKREYLNTFREQRLEAKRAAGILPKPRTADELPAPTPEKPWKPQKPAYGA